MKKFVPGPLWTESESYKARRRCRTLLAMPFAALGGLAWGVFSAEAIGIGSQLLWGSLGAFAFAFLIYMELRLVPPLATLANRLRAGSELFAVLVWEVAVVGGLAFLLTRVLGAPLIPAVGTALGFGAVYTLAMEYLVCGSAASDLSSLLQATGGGGRPLPEQFSRAEALVHSGRFDEAIGVYETAIERDPYSGASYLGLARANVAKGAHGDAVAALRRGLARASLSRDNRGFFVRQLHELCSTKLGDPEEAIEDLRTLLEHETEGPYADWAAQALKDIESGTSIEGTSGPEEGPDLLTAGDVERFDRHPTAGAEPGAGDRLGVEGPRRLRVEEGFHLPDSFTLGEGLVLEEGLTKHELFAGAWDSEMDRAGDESSDESDDETVVDSDEGEGDPGDQHREENA